jgi:predicted Zn-dependent protease with MMP-like domain
MLMEDFEKLVLQALEDLPGNIRSKIKNVAIVIEDNPDSVQLKKVGVRQGNILLGLYEGVPQNAWGKGFGNHLPDKITIFKNSVERFATTPEEIKKLAKKVVLHEIAHYFGFDEKGARKIERRY